MQTQVSWIIGHHFELEGVQPHEWTHWRNAHTLQSVPWLETRALEGAPGAFKRKTLSYVCLHNLFKNTRDVSEGLKKVV